MAMLILALKRLKNRSGSAALTVLTIAISVMWLRWERVEQGAPIRCSSHDMHPRETV